MSPQLTEQHYRSTERFAGTIAGDSKREQQKWIPEQRYVRTSRDERERFERALKVFEAIRLAAREGLIAIRLDGHAVPWDTYEPEALFRCRKELAFTDESRPGSPKLTRAELGSIAARFMPQT